jgi:hypothetical protein
MIGKNILQNKIIEKLGEGGMGVVYDDCAYGDYFEKSDYSNILLFGHGTRKTGSSTRHAPTTYDILMILTKMLKIFGIKT